MITVNDTEYKNAYFHILAQVRSSGVTGADASKLEPMTGTASRVFLEDPDTDWFEAAGAEAPDANEAKMDHTMNADGAPAMTYDITEGTIVSWTLSQTEDGAIEETIEILARKMSMESNGATVEADIEKRDE